MSMQTKIPVVMRQAITKYTDIRDELEDFRDFLQDICCDIGGTVEEIEDQIDVLCDKLITYNETAERYNCLSGRLHSFHALDNTTISGKRSEKDELPFPLAESQETV